ncbi:hypothetical protein EFK50_01120 [Nocardioides marmoriginsengisoli]|uniref:Transposase n=1 Tax=Nocardioides marmoriginsengisoli TaxID=661483 RepID=A0A3N0CS26_9ACTN|nr:DUF6221 family protein [Nocardioides marmoriginsengisoli]RNL66257.1 hypothetical protein EFK50_01120 [Nocardioides marmoriginsengisoli]
MTLIEFLLARVSDDEAQAANVSLFVGPGPDFKPQYRGIRPRVLADCEAKRQIISMHPIRARYCDGCGMETEHPQGCLNLRALAAIYADHADYDQTWRLGP